MAHFASAHGTGNSSTPSVAVPASVAADDIALLACTIDTQTADFAVGDWPTGFTELHDVNCTAEGQSTALGWKRLTGADSGSYTFADLGASGDWICEVTILRGRHTTDPPTSTSNVVNTAASSPITVTATGVTAVEGDDLVWFSAPDVTSGPNVVVGHDPPTNFTERIEAGVGGEGGLWVKLAVATRDNVSAGATGNISGTLTLSAATAGYVAFLVRVPVAGAGGGATRGKPFGHVGTAFNGGRTFSGIIGKERLWQPRRNLLPSATTRISGSASGRYSCSKPALCTPRAALRQTTPRGLYLPPSSLSRPALPTRWRPHSCSERT
jgi:hypothetical protein